MPLADLRAITLRQWALAIVGGSLIACVVLTTAWTVRHASAIRKLNRGVGDTVFLDAAGHAWFRLDDQRRDVPFDQISTYLKDAVIAVEDHRFYLHPGIDPIALTRALFNNVRSDTGMQGGSTITQQLARTLFLSNTRTYGRKVKEATLAVMLEALLTKREILAAVHESRLSEWWGVRRRVDVPEDVREAGIGADAGRGSADRRDHPRAGVVFALVALRRIART